MRQRYTKLFILAGISMLSACGNDDGQKNVNRGDLERISQAAARSEDHVTVQQLAEWIIGSRQDYQLIDIRKPGAFASGHIKDAVNIPLASLVSPDGLAKLGEGKKLVVYSNGSENAAKAAVMLRMLGRDGYLLSGGYNAWQQQVLNPDIPAEAFDDEAPLVAKKRAISCYFAAAPGAAVKPVQVRKVQPVKRPFSPPVNTSPVPPPGLSDEGC